MQPSSERITTRYQPSWRCRWLTGSRPATLLMRLMDALEPVPATASTGQG